MAVGQHGLAGMRLRMEAHGGSIQVQSSPGQGTKIQGRMHALPREGEQADTALASTS
jgi:signal transduction histidine kinase